MSSKEFAASSEYTSKVEEPNHSSEYQQRRASFSKLMREIMKEQNMNTDDLDEIANSTGENTNT